MDEQRQKNGVIHALIWWNQIKLQGFFYKAHTERLSVVLCCAVNGKNEECANSTSFYSVLHNWQRAECGGVVVVVARRDGVKTSVLGFIVGWPIEIAYQWEMPNRHFDEHHIEQIRNVPRHSIHLKCISSRSITVTWRLCIFFLNNKKRKNKFFVSRLTLL